jgi:hypothetical protein
LEPDQEALLPDKRNIAFCTLSTMGNSTLCLYATITLLPSFEYSPTVIISEPKLRQLQANVA